VGYKGWLDFLALADRLRGERLRFLIAGDGPDRSLVKREIERLGLGGQVELLGQVADMPAFYRQLDLLVVASRRESFGLALLEAQACGVPGVAYDLPALREVAGGGSVLFAPQGDVAALAEAARALLGNPERRARLVELGLANAGRYGLPAYLERLERIYRAARAGEGAPG
jgi:glycosyltransferase involved in cell wall biosynthesis